MLAGHRLGDVSVQCGRVPGSPADRLMGVLASTRCRRLEPHRGDAGSSELGVDPAARLRIEVSGFDTTTSATRLLSSPETKVVVGVGQLEPPGPGGLEPAGRESWRYVAGETDLFGEAATNRSRMHIAGDLLTTWRFDWPIGRYWLQPGVGRGQCRTRTTSLPVATLLSMSLWACRTSSSPS